MIDPPEVRDWTSRFGVASEAIVRDHFVSHILAAIGEANSELRFYGGTALCRTYLDGSRLSEAIDLLDPDPQRLLDTVQAEVPRALRHEFPDAGWSDDGREGDGVVAFLSSPGVRAIKIYVGRDSPDTRAWDYRLTEVQLRYSDLPETVELTCPTRETFAAMKLVAWYDRHAPRDLFDLAGLADDPELDVELVEATLERASGLGFVDAELGRLPRTVVDSWEPELAAQVGVLPSADECRNRAGRVFRPSPSP